MGYGDEMSPATVTRNHPERVSRPRRYEPEIRLCSECMGDTTGPGGMCADCRTRQPLTSPVFVQSTIADAARRLEKLDPRDLPQHVRLPLQQALSAIRHAYDAVEPLIQVFGLGRVIPVGSEFWAYPCGDDSVRLGPFGSREHAEQALVNRAVERGWEG